MNADEFDAVVIGAGLNGLVAAATLAGAGWRVVVLEAADRPGGAVRTAAVTLPGFLHDLYATNFTQFARSSFHSAFMDDLHACGLRFHRADKAFGTVFPDGRFIGVETDLQATVARLRTFSETDAEAWEGLARRFQRLAPAIGVAMHSPMPSWGTLHGLPAAPLLLRSAGGFARSTFENPRIRVAFAAWGLHLDFAPHVPGGALYSLLSAMGTQTSGVTLVDGGASRLIDAIVAVIERYGGSIRCGAPVERIITRSGRASGVEVAGRRIVAHEAVIANLAPTPLARLVDLPMRKFRHGPGTLMIHLAMSDEIPWIAGEASAYAYVHIAPAIEALSEAYESAIRGRPPRSPLLVVAQPTTVDPARAPQGRHVVSIQVRPVPTTIEAAGYGDHVLAMLSQYAPGIEARILKSRLMGPMDLEAANPNLVGGDSIGGSHHLSQQFLWRPFLGWSRYRTPLPGLYMVGASAWPGAGTGAASGWSLAKMLVEGRTRQSGIGRSRRW